MQFVCPLCEIEMESPRQVDLPPKSGGCTHSWSIPKIIVTASSISEAKNAVKDILDALDRLGVKPDPKIAAEYKAQFVKPSPLASRLKEQADNFIPHLIVEARAGTGKTTTLVWGILNMFKDRCPGIWESLELGCKCTTHQIRGCTLCRVWGGLGFQPIPSPQQAKVWESMALSKNARTIQFTAFNKSIVREFEGKWGWVQEELRNVGVTLNFNTNHSMGFAAVRRAFPRIDVSEYRVMDLISELLGKDIRELRKNQFEMLKGTERLVGLCKMNLLDGENQDDLQQLVSHHDLDIDGYRSEVFDLVPKILLLCKDPTKDGRIDYDDMVWLPVVHKLSVVKNDLLLVDECQDLNRCQQALAKMAGHRLILVGDPKQAIYGFAGADVESMPRMAQELGISSTPPRCTILPLTMTRRCGKAIVREANKIVPDIEAFQTNPEGEVLQALYPTFERNGKTEERKFEDTYLALVQDGDMVLCRVNAPLVSQCFRFLKKGIKANIQGRDVGQGLITTIQKMGAESLPILVAKIGDWLELESSKERAKRNPSESRIIALQDRHDCILAFTEGTKEVFEIIKKIESIFTDDRSREGIRLSSIHKAKGLEAKRVFILQPKGASIPHPLAKSPWQVGQEYNLLYVAITRAINSLYFVS